MARGLLRLPQFALTSTPHLIPSLNLRVKLKSPSSPELVHCFSVDMLLSDS
ncbi:unnamed protein product [Protopolystoma xenopodis]|uniref:Uncharacterized protein n=1 Tax=Protopolystoma xenopodis TaxID=117903 RepID=A0A448XRN7_9PLAT|nr:unnamed protein product [Protopolystoma xenopodis]